MSYFWHFPVKCQCLWINKAPECYLTVFRAIWCGNVCVAGHESRLGLLLFCHTGPYCSASPGLPAKPWFILQPASILKAAEAAYPSTTPALSFEDYSYEQLRRFERPFATRCVARRCVCARARDWVRARVQCTAMPSFGPSAVCAPRFEAILSHSIGCLACWALYARINGHP